jgi:exosortase
LEIKTNHSLYPFLSATILIPFFVWAFWPVAVDLVETWDSNEDYSHGFFIIPVCCYLIWKKDQLSNLLPDRSGWLGVLGVIIGLVLYLIGLFSQFSTLANLSLIIVIWTSLLFLFGLPFLKNNSWELFLLVFMLPIPSRLYASITLPLQLVVTKASYIVLQVMGIPVYREGNILQLSNTTLEVINACSGLRSILTIVVLAFIVACLVFNSPWRRIWLICCAIPLAMLTNLIRVAVIAFLAHQGNTRFIDGTWHTLLGIGLFGLSLLLLFTFARAIEWIFPEK